MNAVTAFELTGALPRGRLAIEASAGTGKTYALAALATRYVAEAGIGIDKLLVVTFTRAAAAELKDRIRTRLVEAHAAMEADHEPDDQLAAHLWRTDRDLHRRRLHTAVAEFDTATITTIHGFAQQVLGALGTAVPTDPDAALADDSGALLTQVATDLLATEALGTGDAGLQPDLAELTSMATLALSNADNLLIPEPDIDRPPGPTRSDHGQPGDNDGDQEEDPAASARRAEAAVRRRLVDRLLEQVRARRRAAGVMAFDDVLVHLRDALTDPDTVSTARRLLRQRFAVVLIDEFQDTDPVQWTIFNTCFGHNDGEPGGQGDDPDALVLVGDPKQAIYGFRGASVHTYLEAAHVSGVPLRELDINWRSDAAVLRALEALLVGVTFGDDRIGFHPVKPAHHEAGVGSSDGDAGARLRDRQGRARPAVSVRIATGPGVPRTKNEKHCLAIGDSAVFADLATYLAELLATTTIPDGDGGERPLRPQDIAVLTTTGYECPQIRQALRAEGIPAVISRGDNVLASEAAGQWHRLLWALARPSDARRARSMALSWFGGWTAAELADADDLEVAALQERLHRWGEVLATDGVAAFVGTVRAETGVAGRVLALADGDRAMTDLDHVAEILQLTTSVHPSASVLLATFESLAAGDDEDPSADLAARRVESEASAVQIMTAFVAKGLEFPVVCCPSLWRPKGARAYETGKPSIVYWDDERKGRVVDVAGKIPWTAETDWEHRRRRADAEAVGSNLRLLYVALTRARHHTAVWWLPIKDAWITGLARVLFARDADGVIDPEAFGAEAVQAVMDGPDLEALAPLVERAGGTIEVVQVGAPDPDADADDHGWHDDAAEPGELTVATLGRSLDRHRGRWSFSAVTARGRHELSDLFDPFDDSLGDAGAGDEPNGREHGGTGDAGDDLAGSGRALGDGGEPAEGGGNGGAARDGREGPPLLLGHIAGGAGFGTLVHEVLERIDFTAPDLEGELTGAVTERLAWNPWPVDVDELVAGLAAVVRTPLGPQFAGRSLADLQHADRLDEMVFDLTLGDGGSPASDAAIGRLLVDHLDADHPLGPWAAALADGPFSATLCGHLTGSIDLVARVAHPDGGDRFVVVDYKSNQLTPRDESPSAAHYHPDLLGGAMTEHHYPLQALLYSVALHRYLRWRVAAYDPAVHLGGIAYLFLRGMVGPDTPTADTIPHGVFSWQPSAELVGELSDLLDGSLQPVATR